MSPQKLLIIAAICSIATIVFTYLSQRAKNKIDDKLAKNNTMQITKIAQLQEDKNKLNEKIIDLLEAKYAPCLYIEEIYWAEGVLHVSFKNIGQETIRSLQCNYQVAYQTFKDGKKDGEHAYDIEYDPNEDNIWIQMFPVNGLDPRHSWNSYWDLHLPIFYGKGDSLDYENTIDSYPDAIICEVTYTIMANEYITPSSNNNQLTKFVIRWSSGMNMPEIEIKDKMIEFIKATKEDITSYRKAIAIN